MLLAYCICCFTFSSLFYLASAKICSHTYHQPLTAVPDAGALLTNRTGAAHQRDDNHSYIYAVGVFLCTLVPWVVFYPPHASSPCARAASKLHLKLEMLASFLMDDFHGNSTPRNKNKHKPFADRSRNISQNTSSISNNAHPEYGPRKLSSLSFLDH